jgi:hypothetical protein
MGAEGNGGNGNRGGGNGGGGNHGGGRPVGTGVNGNNEQTPGTRVKWPLQKAPMPAAASVSKIDLLKLKKLLDDPSLTDDQKKKIEAARKPINAESAI